MDLSTTVEFKEEALLASSIEVDQLGLIALIEACQDPLNPKLYAIKIYGKGVANDVND